MIRKGQTFAGTQQAGRRRLLLLRTSKPGAAFQSESEPCRLSEDQVLAPVGLLYLASMIRNRFASSLDVAVDSLSTAVRSRDHIPAWLREVKPDILGISSMTVEEDLAAEVAMAAREANPAVTIILGGPYPTFQAHRSLERTGADVAVRGEGEQVIVPLLEALLGSKGLEQVRSLAFRSGRRCVLTPLAPPIDPLDSVPFPAWDLVPVGAYSRMRNMNGLPPLRPPYAPIVTSRGCPGRCSFCSSMFGRKFRGRSPEDVLEEMAWLHGSFGVREFHVIDDVFNLDGKRMEEICRGILRSGLKIALALPNGIRGDILTFEQIRLLREAGCTSMTLSVESASPRILKLMRRKIRLDRLEENARYASSIGIVTRGVFMVGYPGETREELEETLRWVKESSFDLFQHSIACPLPGMEMARHAAAFRKGSKRLAGPATSDNALRNLSAMGEKEFRHCLSRGIGEIRSFPRRLARMREIRKHWGPEAEAYFDGALAGGARSFPVHGVSGEMVPRTDLESLVEKLLEEGGLGPGWAVAGIRESKARFVLPDGKEISILVTYRDDARDRLGHTKRFNLTYMAGQDDALVPRESIEKIVEAFQRADPLDAASVGTPAESPRVSAVLSKSTRIPDVWLIFPPLAGDFEGPEGGLSYIASYLKSRGKSVIVSDMNVHVLHRHPDLAAKRLGSSASPGTPGPAAGISFLPPSLRLADVDAWVNERHPFYEELLMEFLGALPGIPPLIGFSICSPGQIAPALWMARFLKAYKPPPRIVIGGPWCAAARHLLGNFLRVFSFLDAAVPFDGEPVLENLAALPREAQLDQVPGVFTRGACGMARPPRVLLLDALPAPDFSDLPLHLYRNPSLPIKTVRGCVWGRCLYCCCLHPGARRRTDAVDPSIACRHIGSLVRQTGLTDFTLANHLTPPEDLLALAAEIEKSRLDISWTSMARFDPGFKLPLLRHLAGSGCRSLLFGLESIEPEDQKKIGKNLDPRTVVMNLEHCMKAGVGVDVTIMTFPGQKAGGFEKTLEFLLNWGEAINSATVLRFQLGSTAPVYGRPEKLGLTILQDDDNLNVFDLPYKAQRELSEQKSRKLTEIFYSEWRKRKNSPAAG